MDKKESSVLSLFTDYVPIGYLYLILLGIASDTIYYGFVGINIMNYSSALDILMSPVARVSGSLLLVVVIFLIPVLFFFYVKFFRSILLKKNNQDASKSFLTRIPLVSAWLLVTAVVIFAFYIGSGIGSGYALKQRLAKKELKIDHTIVFMDGEKIDIKLIGNNSAYFFYVINGQSSVSISPAPNVKRIESISKTAELSLKDK